MLKWPMVLGYRVEVLQTIFEGIYIVSLSTHTFSRQFHWDMAYWKNAY